MNFTATPTRVSATEQRQSDTNRMLREAKTEDLEQVACLAPVAAAELQAAMNADAAVRGGRDEDDDNDEHVSRPLNRIISQMRGRALVTRRTQRRAHA